MTAATNSDARKRIEERKAEEAGAPQQHRMNFPGNVTGRYNHDAGTGLVGKIVGQGERWFVVIEASYDELLDQTVALCERIPHPEKFFNAMMLGN